MSHTPLQTALAWWAGRDEMGGFATVAAALFPGWTPKASCRAPHRDDRTPSFSLYRRNGAWRFKDHATGEGGGLVDFVMLAGMDEKAACRWLMEGSDTGCGLRPVGAVDPNRPRHAHSPRMIAEGESQPHTHGCGRLGSIAPTAPSFAPYSMLDAELRRCVSMAQALLRDREALRRIASARNWNPDTLHDLALDPCLGLHDGHLVMIYPTGAKKRLKPLAVPGEPSDADSKKETQSPQSPKFRWMFGKPHALWRGDRLLACTERVHLTEGETAAISLIDAGIGDDITEIVMAIPGASSWRNEWESSFRGLRVTLWPDADSAGAGLMERVIASLGPVAKSIETATQV